MKKTSAKGESPKPKTALEFDKHFEDHDITGLLQIKPFRVNLDLPPAMLARIDSKAQQLGLTRQSIIKYWIAERLKMTS